VALVEKEALGGTCLNWGCIPTKTLIAASDLYARATSADRMGLKTGEVSFDYAAMSKRKDDVVAGLKGGVEQLLGANGVTVLTGTASFAGRNRIVVKPGSRKKKGSGDKTIEAANTIIATGSVSAMPSFLPDSKRVVDSRAFLGLKKLPEKLIVLGGGVIGCEFACMAAQLRVEVTVVEMLEDILMILDADVRRVLRKHMEDTLGIRVLTGKPMKDIKATKTAVSGKFEKTRLEADLMLVAVGRRPATEGLGPDKAGLETREDGSIEADEFCRTGAATIYAVGDVTGRWQLAHAATSQGITAAENACGGGRKAAETLVPSCIFTAPEIGSVGLSEQEAKEAGLQVKTGRYTFAALGRAMAAGDTEGFVKWVAAADTGQLLGAHAVGPHATELIAEATVAIRAELTTGELGRTVHCHPTFSETWMEAAHAVEGECIHLPPKKRTRK